MSLMPLTILDTPVHSAIDDVTPVVVASRTEPWLALVTANCAIHLKVSIGDAATQDDYIMWAGGEVELAVPANEQISLLAHTGESGTVQITKVA